MSRWFQGWPGDAARYLVRKLVRLYYPSIEITHRDRLPAAGPVLVVANHPNSMLDPVLVGITLQRPVHFLAKAPLFHIPVFGQIMHALGMLPAYRACDDARQMKRNLASLSLAAARLTQSEAVGIFPEGKSHDLPKVDQVKSGAARIALEAWEKGTRNLVILPLGLNYQRKDQFASAVWIEAGEPIRLDNWLDSQPSEERIRVKALTSEIDRRLKAVSIHLNLDSLEPVLNDLEWLHPPPPDRVHNPIARLQHRRRIAAAMNYFLETDPPRAQAVANAIERHRKNLLAEGIPIHSQVLLRRGPDLVLGVAGRALGLLAGFLVILPATLHHLAPFFLTRLLARFLQTKGRSTRALARLGSGLPIYGAWYGMVWWWISRLLGPGAAWLWTLAMPFLGLLALRYWYFIRSTGRFWIRECLLLFQPATLRRLKEERDRLNLGALAEEYRRQHPESPTY
jgi:1-acyl-sn-glycerol-3-phosphate acyltransferase